MSMREYLQLDHFYIDVNEEDFQALLKLIDVFKSDIRHVVVKTEDDQWEGIYLRSRIGTYFEILRKNTPDSLGIAFRTPDPISLPASRVTADIPVDWKTSTTKLPDGQLWFSAYFTRMEAEPIIFKPWIMDYHQHVAEPRWPLMPRAVDRFKSLKMSVGREYVEQIRVLSEWFPGKREFSANHVGFEFQDRDAWPFKIDIELVDGSKPFQLEEVVIEMYDVSSLPDFTEMQLGSFKLLRQNNRLGLAKARKP